MSQLPHRPILSPCIHYPVVAYPFGKGFIVLYFANVSDIGLLGDGALVVIGDYGDEGALGVGKQP